MNLRARLEVYAKLSPEQSLELIRASYGPLNAPASSCYNELCIGERHSSLRGQQGDQPTLSEVRIW